MLIQSGGALTIQADGIKALPAAYQIYMANNVKKGARIKTNLVQHLGGNGTGVLREARLLGVGEKAYLTRLEVKENEIIFSIQSCGSCNPAGPDANDMPYRASLAFQFAKGYLAGADSREIEEMIAGVFASEAAAPMAPATAAVPEAAPPAAPPTIALGQSKDEVATVLGQPDRVAKVGNKEIWFYKDMKVTLLDGKVSDVQ